mmetsp:Transcript_77274/g.194353  ORF Transcript_77274/g.194353 Transcript_77274/m.194353 type:complete len:227 (+) Transcript_77274:27-707(+)
MSNCTSMSMWYHRSSVGDALAAFSGEAAICGESWSALSLPLAACIHKTTNHQMTRNPQIKTANMVTGLPSPPSERLPPAVALSGKAAVKSGIAPSKTTWSLNSLKPFGRFQDLFALLFSLTPLTPLTCTCTCIKADSSWTLVAGATEQWPAPACGSSPESKMTPVALTATGAWQLSSISRSACHPETAATSISKGRSIVTMAANMHARTSGSVWDGIALKVCSLVT